MRKNLLLILFALAFPASSLANNNLPAIDLTALDSIPMMSPVQIDGATVHPIAYHHTSPRRFYITGLWGPSFANLNWPADSAENTSATIFTAGIAGGVSFERQHGRLRLETEWLSRDFYGAYNASKQDRTLLANNWSVTANLWRDFMFTQRIGCYGGGGIGAGGYKPGGENASGIAYDEAQSAFAWQAGGGLIYEVSDQVTLDVSYRYYQLDDILYFQRNVTQYSASQVMFAMRIFEPFRTLWR
jgi:opacity protein-like surface antigen